MAFSRSGGPIEGAVLVFANTAREAKKVAFPVMDGDIWDGWIDLAVWWLQGDDNKHLFESEGDKELLARGLAHVIDNPKSCNACERWGPEIMASGMCDKCSRDYLEWRAQL